MSAGYQRARGWGFDRLYSSNKTTPLVVELKATQCDTCKELLKQIEELENRIEALVKAQNENRLEIEALQHYFANDWGKYKREL